MEIGIVGQGFVGNAVFEGLKYIMLLKPMILLKPVHVDRWKNYQLSRM